MTESDLAVFQQSFFQEATELLNDLETHLLDLEDHKHDVELLHTIFRCAHSIKGGSATFGFPDIAEFTHGLETLLDQVREGRVQVTAELCQVLFLSLDQMRLLLSRAMGNSVVVPNDSALTAQIRALSESTSVVAMRVAEVEPAVRAGVSVTYNLHFAPGPDVMRFGGDPCLLLAQLTEIADIVSVNRDDSRIPRLSEIDPECCYVAWDIRLTTSVSPDEILEIFDFVIDESDIRLTEVVAEDSTGGASDSTPGQDSPTGSKSAAIDQASPTAVVQTDHHQKPETSMLRVPADKVDRLVNLVGELVITQSMLNEVAQNIDMAKQPLLFEAISAMERASRELQERIMGIRLVQLKHAFARFPRLVRDLSSSIGKKIDLVTVGEETELDKTLIEGLGDPLTHLIRNAIDHGLEIPADRLAAGKPEHGTIRISSRYEGGNVIIEVIDDGKGLDRDRILAKAIEKGLASEADSLTDDAIFGFIFHPGFSTAKAVTDLSGRGVGMDIVRKAIQSMNGSINVSTQAGVGTTFRIRLPLTMAILEGLSLKIGKETYILPLTSIVESIRPGKNDLSLVAGRFEVVQVRGEVLPVLRLHKWFGIETEILDPCEGLLVIVENEGSKVALLVDELITQNQAVIKSLEANYKKVAGITGATILGDGRVALIIDVPGLLRGINDHSGPVQLVA